MTKAEDDAIGSLVAAVYGELAELHYTAGALADTVAALNAVIRRMASIDYGVEDSGAITIA